MQPYQFLITLFFTVITFQQALAEEDDESQSPTMEFEVYDEETDDTISINADSLIATLMAGDDSLSKAMNFETGIIILGDELATLTVPEGYKYLNPEQSAYVLSDVWGNPPSETLGMLFPEESNIYTYGGYVIDINWDDIGYIEDDEANEIDYDDMMDEMKKDAKDANEYRAEYGYEEIEIVGWAAKPFYDATDKTLHWAKELKFGEAETNTLNYNIRFLGRNGVLEMNFISDMDQLEVVESDIPAILSSTTFKEGSKYEDFDPEYDKIAAVGIGGLVAGKVLAKGGFFALIAKFGKVIFLAIAAGFGFLWKKLRGE